jgi:hypothetical protein
VVSNPAQAECVDSSLNPSAFPVATADEKKQWKEFRQALNKSDRKAFDNMFLAASLYNSACSYTARSIRIAR